MKSKISINDQRIIQLEMLDEIDSICQKEGLKYSISYGTLIGAIRHKGFIPWDDDVDIEMPFVDMLRFKEILNSKIIKINDVDSETNYEYPFPRISYIPTFSKKGLMLRSYGVNIDLYPVIGVPDEEDEIKLFFEKAEKINVRRKRISAWNRRILKLLPFSIPHYNKIQRDYRDYLFSFHRDNTNTFFSISGDFFNELIKVEFEGHHYMAYAQYDVFLKKYYGDYMQLPPEEQRHPYHGGDYYWK